MPTPHLQIGGSASSSGRPPRSPPARRAPPARHRPHAPADSRNRSARRRPCTWRQSRRSGRPSRRRAVIGADDLAQILGIEPRRERGRADEIAEHHRQLAPFGLASWRCSGTSASASSAGRQPGAGAERRSLRAARRRWPTEVTPDADQIVGRQLGSTAGRSRFRGMPAHIVRARGRAASPLCPSYRSGRSSSAHSTRER